MKPDCKIWVGYTDGSTGITLNESEYDQLYGMREEVNSYFQNDDAKPNTVFFEGSPNKRIKLKTYKEYKMIIIREMIQGSGRNYGTLYPTKNRIAIGGISWSKLLDQYTQVSMFLSETKRVFETVRGNVILQLTEFIDNSCTGCLTSHGSQLRHECLTHNWRERAEKHYSDAVSSLNIVSITKTFNHTTFLSFEFCKQIITINVLHSKQYVM